MSEWQPIATAPKDGTEVFAWGTLECSPFSRPHVGCNGIERALWDGEGWLLSSAQADGGTWVCGVTHWQPLPAPPTEEPARG